MNWHQSKKPLIVFVLFFCLGLGLFYFVHDRLAPEKPITGQEKTGAAGTVSQVAARVSPSVVGVNNMSGDTGMFDSRSTESTGSGVIVDPSGYIVTNNHVVEGAGRLVVTLVDGSEKEARIIGADPATDLALIKIES